MRDVIIDNHKDKTNWFVSLARKTRTRGEKSFRFLGKKAKANEWQEKSFILFPEVQSMNDWEQNFEEK